MIPGDELKVRRDMRSHRTMSIDPPGCTDVDDAVSVSFHEYFDVALKWLVALPFLLASTTIIRYANKDALERDVFGSASIPHFAFGGKHA